MVLVSFASDPKMWFDIASFRTSWTPTPATKRTDE